MRKPLVNSVDVAKRANVSQSAVSRTFTPGASVSEKTRERVLKAARELGYRPNALARSLISGTSKIVGLVVAYLENRFYPSAVEKLSRGLQNEGYHVLMFVVDPGEQDELIKRILEYQVDGVVLASVILSSPIAEECQEMGVPVVMFNRFTEHLLTNSVTSDNVAGGKLVADLFAQKRYQRIAYIAGFEESSTNRDREMGFREGLKQHGLSLWRHEVGGYTFDGAARATRIMLSDQERPDAIFVANDHMAFAAMDVIRQEFGLSVPEDIAIVGYDNVPEASWQAYHLTTVEQPLDEMVSATIELLMNQMTSKKAARERVVVEATLIERSTTD